MLITRTVRAVTGVVVTACALAGCAEAGRAAPAAQVDAAFSSLLDTGRLTVAAGLDLDPASRARLAEVVAADGGPSAAATERLLSARVVTTLVADHGDLADVALPFAASDLAPVSSSVAVQVEGRTLVEVREVDGTTFVRADLPALEDTLGTPGLAATVASGVVSGWSALEDKPTRVTVDLVPPARAVRAADVLAAGGWVEVGTDDLVQAYGTPAQDEGWTDADGARGAVEGFVSDAAAVLRREVVVEATGDGSFEVTAPLDRVLADLTPSVVSLVEGLLAAGAPIDREVPGAWARGAAEDAADDVLDDVRTGTRSLTDELAGRVATAQVGLDAGRLATLRLDVLDVADEQTRSDLAAQGVTALPLLLTFSTQGEVVVPTSPTPVDGDGLLAGAVLGVPWLLGVQQEVLDGPLGSADVGTLRDVEPWTPEELEAAGLGAEQLGIDDEDVYTNYLGAIGIVVAP